MSLQTQEVVSLWSQNFPNVTVITSPEMGDTSLTLAHGMPNVTHMHVDGLKMKSPIFTMALYSSEVAIDANGVSHYAHAYEIMAKNIPSKDGSNSSMEEYTQALWQLGMKVHSDHYHWKTAELSPVIHHMGVDMTPLDFSRRTITALNRMMQKAMINNGGMPSEM